MQMNHPFLPFFLTSFLAIIGCAAGSPPTSQPTTRQATDQGASLFDGKTLAQWKVIDYAGAGEPRVEDNSLILPAGERLTGVSYTGEVPKNNYEVSFLARRIDGTDFFAGLTFPVADSHATLILGGWGGATCGISSIDGEDAAHNDLRSFRKFDTGKWYRVRLRVTSKKIQAWVDDESIIDFDPTGKKLTLRSADMEASTPLGFSAFATEAAVKEIRLKKLDI